MLTVKNIRMAYTKERQVLDGLSFTLGAGQILSILGPNGAGKTTLLKCINAMISPQAGVVQVENHDIFSMSATEIARHLGYVAQKNEAVRLTTFDAVLLGRKPHLGWRVTAKDLKKVAAILKQLDLEHLALRHLDQMSGGELQKVCLARALVQEPRVLLLDEPTSSLDLKNQLDMLTTVQAIVKQHGIAAVMTMHDLNLALRFTDQFIFMKQGRVHACGRPAEIDAGMVQDVYGVAVDIIKHRGQVVLVPVTEPAMHRAANG
ncbi:MAG: Iron(3+)-hydroxamate import ATP-binding protein FhuC [Deltaproteobacteria bacterium ADurb.Bin510]|nr:MAG: Iron(3+)-hydroxamate import ATP-binding protein FhuC [Deltaproteobacteria bacterium ADurb.Bin510]